MIATFPLTIQIQAAKLAATVPQVKPQLSEKLSNEPN